MTKTIFVYHLRLRTSWYY